MAELNDSLCEEDIVQGNSRTGKPFILFNQVSKEVSEAKDLNDSLNEEEFKTLSQLQSPSFLQKEVTTECLKKIKRLHDSLDDSETGCKNGLEKTSFNSPALDLNKSNNNAVDVRFHSEEILHCSAVASVIMQQSPKESAHSPMGVSTGLDIPIQTETNRAKVKPSFGKKTKKPSVPAGLADSVRSAATSADVSKKQKTTSAKKSDKSRDVGRDMKQKSFDKSKPTKSQLSKAQIKTDENVKKPESTLLLRDLATLDPKMGTNTEKIASGTGIAIKPNFSAKKSFCSDANVQDQVIDSERILSRKEVPKKPHCSVKKAFSSDAINKEVSDSEKIASRKQVPKKPNFSAKKACVSDADKKDKVGSSEKISSKSEIPKKPDFSVKKTSSMEASNKDKVSNSEKTLTKAPRKKTPEKPDIPVEKICSSDASSALIGDQASEKLLLGKIQVKSSQENRSPDQIKEILSLDLIQEEKMQCNSGQPAPLHNKQVTNPGIQKKPKRKPLNMEERAENVKKQKLKNEDREKEKRSERESKEKEEEKARKKEKRETLKAVRKEIKIELEKKIKLKAQQKKNSESDSSLVSPDKREDIVFPENVVDKLEIQLDAFKSDDSSTISLNLTSPLSHTSNPLPSSKERPAKAVTSKQQSLEETTANESGSSSSSSETRPTTLANLKRPSLEATTASESRAKRLKSEDSDTTTNSDSTFRLSLSSEMESGIVMLDSPNSMSTDQSDPSPFPVSKRKPRANTRMQANMTGPVWVQCCNIYCRKWRQLKGHFDPLSVPAFWKCSDNTDQEYNHCSVPTEEWVRYENEEFQFVESTYIPGSVVWAKMDSYPWWPAMIEADPDEECYFEMGHSDSIVPVKYHVVFFGTPVSRYWLNACRVIPYTDVVDANEVHRCHVSKSFKKSLEESKADATRAVTMHIKERLDEYGFLKRHKVTKKSQWQDSVARAKPKPKRGRPRKLKITLTKAEKKAMGKNLKRSVITRKQTSKSKDSNFGDRSNTSGNSEGAMEIDTSSEIQHYQEGDEKTKSCLDCSKDGAKRKQQKLSSEHED